MGLRDWAWRNMTAHGRAWEAYHKGFATYEVTLEVLEPSYRKTLEDITSVGWRLDGKFEHPRVKTTDVTPRPDGGHDVVRSVSQKTTFYFVRDETDPVSRLRSSTSTSTWPAGWHQTPHGWRWWDGVGWTQPAPSPVQRPPYQANFGPTMNGLSNGEHAVHFTLTFFTCGLWAPVWIYRARKRKAARYL